MTSSQQASINRGLLVVLIASVFSLSASFVIEYSGFTPCTLCHLQRVPYVLMGILAGIGIYSRRTILAAGVIAILSLSGFILAIYHIGVQFGIFLDHCLVLKPVDLASFKTMIFEDPLSCSKNQFHILGIPLPGWNALICIICFCLSTRVLGETKSISLISG